MAPDRLKGIAGCAKAEPTNQSSQNRPARDLIVIPFD